MCEEEEWVEVEVIAVRRGLEGGTRGALIDGKEEPSDGVCVRSMMVLRRQKARLGIEPRSSSYNWRSTIHCTISPYVSELLITLSGGHNRDLRG